MDTIQTEQQELPLEHPKEKVEVLSVFGDKEKSWSIDKYHLMVGISIVSVVAIMGGIVWLASGGGSGAGSAATPYPTGELEFSDSKGAAGPRDINSLPYPSVRAANPLLPEKSPSKGAASKTPTPTTADSPTATPTPTSAPSNSSDPTSTPSPTPTSGPTATPEVTIIPTPSTTP